jgi:putative DNA primase/helicase
LEDRAIIIHMRRRRSDERIERLRIDRSAGLDEIARKAARWAVDNQSALREADPNTPDTLHDRAADNWRPLLAIADRVGGEWPVSARTIAQQLSAGEPGEDSSAGTQLLADICTILEDRAVERIASADLVAALVSMEDRPWPEWRRGKPISTRGVARLLVDFEIRPQTIRLDAHNTAKGYLLDDFKDTFTRYIPDLSVTTSQPNETVAFSENLSVTTGDDVTDRKGPKPAETNDCDVVTDKKGGTGDEWGMEI